MMSSAPPKLTSVCTDCGASNPGHLSKCWLCQAPVVLAASGTPFKATAYERHAAFQFSFASLLVTIALIAVLLGVFRLAPGLGVLLAIIVAPAWIRTCITVTFKQSRQGAVTFGQKAGVFATSLAIVIGIGVMLIAAVVGAFAVFCSVVSAGGQYDFSGAGMVVAAVSFGILLVTGLIFWASRKHSRRASP